MNKEDYEYHKTLNKLCVIRNSISLICFTILSIAFNRWWIVLLSAFFTADIGKVDGYDESK